MQIHPFARLISEAKAVIFIWQKGVCLHLKESGVNLAKGVYLHIHPFARLNDDSKCVY